MNNIVNTLLLAACLLLGPSFGFTQTAKGDAPNNISKIEPAIKEIVKVSDTGLFPSTITLSKADSSVFFMNSTSSSLLTFEIDFGQNRVHCWSRNLELDDKGMMRSTRPIGVNDFVLLCFPDEGSYEVKVHGIKSQPSGLKGTVVVR